MKILHVIPTIDKKFGGPVHSLNSFIEVDKYLGYKSEIVSTKSNNSFDYGDTPVHIFNKSFPSRLSRSNDAANWFKLNANHYDYVIFHGVWTYFHFDLAKICRAKYVHYAIRPHSTLDPKDLKKKKYLKKYIGVFFVKPYLEGAKKIICTAEPELDRLYSYGVSISPIIVPLAIMPSEVNLDTKKEYNQQQITFLFLSRIDYKKGLDLFIRAVGKLNPEYQSQIKINIAGDGTNSYKQYIFDLIKENNLNKNVKYLGFISGKEKELAFQNSDIFVLTSYFENFGYAVVEALVRGIPVLISKEVDIWKNIEEYNGGWFSEYNVESITNKLVEILNYDDSEMIEKRKNAKKSASQYYVESVANKYKNIFN